MDDNMPAIIANIIDLVTAGKFENLTFLICSNVKFNLPEELLDIADKKILPYFSTTIIKKEEWFTRN